MATRSPYAMNPNTDYRTTLLPEIRSRFRMVSIVEPEVKQILRIKCFEHNFKNPTVLADKIALLFETIRLYL